LLITLDKKLATKDFLGLLYNYINGIYWTVYVNRWIYYWAGRCDGN